MVCVALVVLSLLPCAAWVLPCAGADARPASAGLRGSVATWQPPRSGPLRRQHRAAATDAASESPAPEEEPQRSKLVLAWAVFGVSAYLSYGVKKVVPIVRQGVAAITSPFQWVLLVATLGFFAYVEGYKGFQLGFSPRVVSRAWAVSEVRGRVSAKELLGKYGLAYLLSSLSLSAISFTSFYFLVRNGVNVASLMAAIGLPVGGKATSAGAVAIAYALHKAASPVRFPPTLALTLAAARKMGKDVDDVQDMLPVWHKVLAPAFCIGYFHGTKKRVISSWCVTTVVFLTVVGVKRLGNPYRAIIDAGVIVGLAWGVVSILVIYTKSLIAGRPPAYDPSLPSGTPYKALA